jgi:hypothetical protein
MVHWGKVAGVIRSFEPADREALISLWRACGLVVPWNDPDRDIDRKLDVEAGGLLVAVDSDSGLLVGSVMAGYDGHRGWVNYLADAVAFYEALGFTHDPVLSMGKRLVDDE